MRLPPLSGRPIEIRFQADPRAHRGRLHPSGDRGVEVHAGTFLRKRLIVLDLALKQQPGELARIFVHELFHFVWLRLGNTRRRSFENLLAGEVRQRVSGDLGWSAESRKSALRNGDLRRRTRRWREYACESFCDTAAWLYSGVARHDEFTLSRTARQARRAWFEHAGLGKGISV